MIVTEAFMSKLREECPSWEGKLPTDEPGFPDEWEEKDLHAWVVSMGLLKPPRPTKRAPPKENGHRGAPLANGNKQDNSSLSAAADLIRTLDTAFSEMSSYAVTAAKDAEDARRNARAASELARLFSEEDTGTSEESSASTPPREKKQPSPPPSNGTATTCREINKTWQPSTPERTVPPAEESQSKTSPNPLENDKSFEHPTHDENMLHDTHQTGSGRKRKNYTPERNLKAISTTERLEQSHAEEVLSLSLELERTKQSYEREQTAHHQTKAALKEAKTKNSQLEAQVQKMLHDMETLREDNGRRIDGLQQELSQAQIRVEAAEEDAQLALDLAKGNAEDREQIETWLQRSLQEVQVLRDQLEHVDVSPDASIPSPSKQSSGALNPSSAKNSVVRFADSPTYLSPESHAVETPKSQPAKSMVAAGRSLLRRAVAVSTPDGGGDDALHLVALTPEKSAERRKKLRQRLQELGENDVEVPTPISRAPPPSIHHGIDMGYATKAMEHCHSVVRLLRESGKRLGLGGHWWTGNPPNKVTDDVNVEAMTRQYCQSVEVSVLSGLCSNFKITFLSLVSCFDR